MFETLSAHGITPSVLQILIVAAIAVVILGMYWQYVIAGAAILFCVYVFVMPTDASTKEVKKPETVKSVVVEEKDDTPIEIRLPRIESKEVHLMPLTYMKVFKQEIILPTNKRFIRTIRLADLVDS